MVNVSLLFLDRALESCDQAAQELHDSSAF